MSDGDEPSALGRWLAAHEGLQLTPGQGDQALRCDYCSGAITKGSRPTQYGSTLDLNPRDDPRRAGDHLLLQRLYCETCNRRQVRFPCRGVLEILVEHTVTDDNRLVEWDVVDHSPRDGGLAWDPEEVVGVHLPVNWIDSIRNGGPQYEPYAVGPEDVLDELIINGIDPRAIIEDDGSTITDPRVVAGSQTDVMEVLDETSDMNRKEYTEFLRQREGV